MKSLAILPILMAVAACGGGASMTEIPPVIATGAPPATLADLAGTPIPFRAVTIEHNGENYDFARQTLGIEVISATAVELVLPQGRVPLSFDPASGAFVGSADGINYSMRTLNSGFDYSEGLNLTTLDDDGQFGGALGYFGLEAPQSRLSDLQATGATGSYTGESFIVVQEGGSIHEHFGTSSLGVDFASGAVDGTIYQSATRGVDLVGGSINGNVISGGMTLSGADFAGFDLQSGGLQAQLYGLDANELHGTFIGDGNGPAGDFQVMGTVTALD